MPNTFYIDYGRMDSLQRAYIDKKITNHMVICGAAGSGKSLIALHKAKQISQLGTFTIIVYTKTLKEYFKDGLKELSLDDNVYYYNEWRKNKSHVDYLIVDECQDFSADEINEIKQYGAHCFLFGDSEQSIMGFQKECQTVQETALALRVVMLPLQKNYRLTKENAHLAEIIGRVDELEENCVRQGDKPSAINRPNINDQIDEIIRLKRNNNLSSVGILMPFNTEKTAIQRTGNKTLSVEYIKNYIQSKGEPVEFKYNANQSTEMELNFDTSNIKVMTWWCAKGLQFSDVFILNCQFDYGEERRRALYVACTRACERIYLLYSGSLCTRFFPNADNQEYFKPTHIDINSLLNGQVGPE